MSIHFYCRESKRRNDGKSPIEMAINLDGSRIITHLPRKESPEAFDRLVRSKKTNPLREYLSALESRLRAFETDCIRNGELLSVDKIREFIEAGYVRKTITVQTLHDDFFQSLRLKRDAGAMTERRFRKYEVALEHFYKGTEIDANEPLTCIKNHTIQDFKHYLIKQTTARIDGISTSCITIVRPLINMGI